MWREYRRCYSNEEPTPLQLEDPRAIKECLPVDCKDFAYSVKLLAEAYDYECLYVSTIDSKMQMHAGLECVIDGDIGTLV